MKTTLSKTQNIMTTMKTAQISVQATKIPYDSENSKIKPDTFATVAVLASDNEKEDEILGKTEVIKNSLTPNWKTNFYIDHDEKCQSEKNEKTFILVKIFDNDIKFGNCYTELASGVFELSALLSSECKTMTKKLKDGGTIEVVVEEDVQLGNLNLNMSGNSLKKIRGRRKKHIPFYQLTRLDHGLSGIEKNVAYCSDVYCENSLNPKWLDQQIDIKTLCRGNINHPILLSVYHYKTNGKHVLMGEVETTMHDLICSQASVRGLEIKKNGSMTGSITVDFASITGVESLEWHNLTVFGSQEESKSSF